MKLILVDQSTGTLRSIRLNAVTWSIGVTVVCLVSALVLLGFEKLALKESRAALDMLNRWQVQVQHQKSQLDGLSRDMEQNLDASASRMANLQARLSRLDALGQRLTEVANLEEGEFNFSEPLGLGGPFVNSDENLQVLITPSAGRSEQAFKVRVLRLSEEIANREYQLAILEQVFFQKRQLQAASLYGRPVSKGWVSSAYGMRTDPISGARAWHNGIDIAGTLGSPITAIASGVVTHAGHKGGYGKMIEINHGDGVKTRYGHHQTLKVATGDIVRKGQVIGEMGSSGRSTGPHIHYEIFKKGRWVDPSVFIHRAPRS
jgi:murein DD-endopeptidase MepM/ murein hydrolase activator NlpD